MFIQKWLDYLVLMTSITPNDSNRFLPNVCQNVSKEYLRNMHTVLQTAGADEKSSWKILELYGGGGGY